MWCEYELNQTTNYAINPGLITSNTPLKNGCIKIVADTLQQQSTDLVDNDCCQFHYPNIEVYMYWNIILLTFNLSCTDYLPDRAQHIVSVVTLPFQTFRNKSVINDT